MDTSSTFRALARDVQTEMTTSSRGEDGAQRACSRHIIRAALLALALLAGGISTDPQANAQAKEKPENTAATAKSPAAKPKAKSGAPAGPAPETSGDAAKGAQPAQNSPATAKAKPADNSKPDAAGKPAAEAAAKPPAWSETEIADARAQCAVVLQRIHAIVLPHEPIKEGACGAPAPIELVSIGQKPQVVLSPPAIVTCDFAEALAGWVERDLQPLARKHLKSEIIKIETMSSYSCRNAYGRKKTRLSEHALANALDIGGFVTATTKTARLLQDWGKPQREIIAELEAEKRAADAAAAKVAGTGIAANPAPAALPLALPSTTGAAAAELARSTIIEGVPAATTELVSVPATKGANHLGGPALPPAQKGIAALKKAGMTAPARPAPDAAERAFLIGAHKAACKIFGTTLGPEANADHLNHFHLDMAERKFTKICS